VIIQSSYWLSRLLILYQYFLYHLPLVLSFSALFFIILVAIVLIIQRMSIIAILGVVFPLELMAQAGVRNVADVTQASAVSEASAVYEIQTLQQEVQTLRGLLEEQAYQIKRLKQQRLDDYLDLDKRVSELARQQQVSATSQNIAGGSVANNSGERLVDRSVDKTAGASVIAGGANAVLGNNSDAANTLYSEAISLLLDKQDYSAAQTKFTEYIDRYQGGQYTPNVYYWTGQILFANGEKKMAADNFELLINEYPDNSKVPDAQFKLARIYFDQDKKKEAREILDKVAASDSDAALLAKSFISKNY
jgi:tol-pal system protein YbgF